jgi:hypothetical protein
VQICVTDSDNENGGLDLNTHIKRLSVHPDRQTEKIRKKVIQTDRKKERKEERKKERKKE